MLISIIVAMGKNGVIGNKGKLPWHLPGDLKYFKSVTMGKPIVMGRHTFESIGKALPGRTNIVLTSDNHFQAPKVKIIHSIDEIFFTLAGSEEIMIIGGANLFEQILVKAQRLYLTYIDQDFKGDRYFPVLNLKEWREVSRQAFEADEKNPYSYSFVILERVN